MLEQTTERLVPPGKTTAAPTFVDYARLEFQAALELLSQRACAITGAIGSAIALEEDGIFIYHAVAGAADREPGRSIEVDAEPYRECLAQRRVSTAGSGDTFTFVVPILRDDKTVGLMELISHSELGEEATNSLIRLADLVGVAVEHGEAAERVERIAIDGGLIPPAPVRWHAPELAVEVAKPQPAASLTVQPAPGNDTEAQLPAPALAAAVHSCSMCGFPVSTARAICVECERKPHAATSAALFELKKEEGWIRAHGYTIASLVVSALTAAIIFWLRR